MSWKPRPNIDFEDQPEFRWPYWRVGLDEDELFGSLYDQFDERIPLLDPVTFHHEIQDIASHVHDKDDFLCQAKDRVNRHAQTIDDMLYSLFITIMEGRSSLSQTQQHKFVHFHQYRSLNSLAVFLSSVVDPNHREDQSFCSECWCPLQAPVKLTAVASAPLHQQACSPRPRIPQQTLPDSRSSFSSSSSTPSSAHVESLAAPDITPSYSPDCSDNSPGQISSKKRPLGEQNDDLDGDTEHTKVCSAEDGATRHPSGSCHDESDSPTNHHPGALENYDDHRPLKGGLAAQSVLPSSCIFASSNSLGQISRKRQLLDKDDKRSQPFKKTRHISSRYLE